MTVSFRSAAHVAKSPSPVATTPDRPAVDRIRFGTDGIRGRANLELTAMVAYRLGRAAATSLARSGGRMVVAQDTRRSGDMLTAGLVAGATSMGVDVGCLGIAPTAALASIAARWRYDAGIMVSASHNPATDNGLKVFDGQGVKLDEPRERELEALMEVAESLPGPGNHALGVMLDAGAELDRYRESREALAGRFRSGLHVVVDAANGAASLIGPALIEATGARVTRMGVEPNGVNINEDCGATAPAALAARVRADGANLGIAFDGDADRCVIVDESGEVVDGDALLGALALDRLARGRLAARTIVVTEASNGGLEDALGRVGCSVVRTPVGDRWVWEGMEHTGASLGGERSGHVIVREHGATGDGIVTALEVLELLSRTGRPMSAVAAEVPLRPQREHAIRVRDREIAIRDAEILRAVSASRDRLGAAGRIIVRASGTESLIRIMVEGPELGRVTAVADGLADLIRQRHPQV